MFVLNRVFFCLKDFFREIKLTFQPEITWLFTTGFINAAFRDENRMRNIIIGSSDVILTQSRCSLGALRMGIRD